MITLDELASAIPGAQIHGRGDQCFESFSTDSRSLSAGALFFALSGEHFDGHAFIAQAIAKGASGLVVLETADVPLPQLKVPDTRRALGAAAEVWRSRFALPLIGVAGSNGKTTVTQMLAAILAAEFGEERRLATLGNLNNDIGVPLTLFRLNKEHAAAAIEMGMNHPGEMAHLAQIARPSVALVNNAQREHQEFMGTVEATAYENGALIEALEAEGRAVFPADDPCAPIWRELAGKRLCLDFGFETEAWLRARYAAEGSRMRLELAWESERLDLSLGLSGRHQAHNAAAAATAALAAGLSLPAIQRGLEGFAPVKGRGVLETTDQGVRLIDDSYNANPDSVLAAIDLLSDFESPRILILGDMGEVGEEGPSFHEEVGRYAQRKGITFLLTLGEMSRFAAEAFGNPGGEHFATLDDLTSRCQTLARPRATLLVKGSRFMKMERVIQAMRVPRPEEQS